MRFQRRFRGGQLPAHGRQFFLGHPTPLLGLGHVRQGFGVLRPELPQALLVEMDAALVPVALALSIPGRAAA